LTTSELRDLTAHAVITVDPDGTEERHQEAAARRELTLRPQGDAMANLSAYLPADGAVKIFQISDLLATSTAGTLGDSRGIGARRVDALVDIADQLLTHGYVDLTHYIDNALPDHGTPRTPEAPANTEQTCSTASTVTEDHAEDADQSRPPSSTSAPTVTPTDADPATQASNPPPNRPSAGRATEVAQQRRSMSRQGRRPHLSVVIGADTLAGKDHRPATLAGFGAIPAGLARSIALSAGTITALFADSGTGAVTRFGALVYRPQQELRDTAAALFAVCQFPSCRQPPWRCDIDHRESFDHQHPERGGRTDPGNAGPFVAVIM
jgi:hypothetical protein